MISIRQRLTLWSALVLTLVLVAFAALVFGGILWQDRRATNRDLRLTAQQLVEVLARNEEPVVVDTAYRLLTLDGGLVRGAGLPLSRVPVTAKALATVRAGGVLHETLATSADLAQPAAPGLAELPGSLIPGVYLLSVPVGDPPAYVLQVGRANLDVSRLYRFLFTALLAALGAGIALATLGGWWLAGRALAPVQAMIDSAQRIGARNLAERLPQPAKDDELGRLARTLNGLLDRLQAAFQHERRFTADISHDLRGPLALIKSTIGVTLNRPRSAEQLRTALTEVDGQIDRLIRLTDAALFLARADNAQLAEGFAPLNLSELLIDLCEPTASHAQDRRGQTLHYDIAPELRVWGNPDQLTRLFLNVLDNAGQYTPEGGLIQVRAGMQDGRVRVDIEDNGPGIAAEDVPHIFERFYRADKARTAGEGDHHGMGLNIAQVIAQAHNGEILVHSTPGQGTVFTVLLDAHAAP